jgi:hypothetical protein
MNVKKGFDWRRVNVRGESERKGYWMCVNIHTYVYRCMFKHIKHWKGQEEGAGEWEYKRGGELVQSTLYACMELSQWNLLYYLSMLIQNKIKQFKNTKQFNTWAFSGKICKLCIIKMHTPTVFLPNQFGWFQHQDFFCILQERVKYILFDDWRLPKIQPGMLLLA